jgi:pimeloyl-ACP methyl ester carboxylesterase
LPAYATKYAAVDGTAVHYLHSGPTTLPDVPPALDRGRLFLLVHAAGSNAAMWRRQIEAAARENSVVALDLPGHGRSSGIEGLASVEAYADFVIAFARAVRFRPFVLVGRSMGGAIGLVIASRHPELLSGLVLACSGPRFPLTDESMARAHDVVRGRLPQQFTTETFSPSTGMDLMREAWMEQVKTDPRVRYTDLLACRAFEGHDLLARVRTPTLVVAGADDGVTPVALSEELAKGIAGARLEVLAAAGHQAPLEQSDAFNRLVGDFAAGLA